MSDPWGVDHVDSMGQRIAQRAKLLVLEDNDAVIATVIKGRSPVLKHCNRTQRIALDWLLERLQNDPGISLRYVSTHDQIADIFTKAAFQGQQWSHLVGLCTLNFPMEPLAEKSKGPASSVVMLGKIEGGAIQGNDRVNSDFLPNGGSYSQAAAKNSAYAKNRRWNRERSLPFSAEKGTSLSESNSHKDTCHADKRIGSVRHEVQNDEPNPSNGANKRIGSVRQRAGDWDLNLDSRSASDLVWPNGEMDDSKNPKPEDEPAAQGWQGFAPGIGTKWMDPTQNEILEDADSRISGDSKVRSSRTAFRPGLGHVAIPRARPEVFNMSDTDSCMAWGSPAAESPTPRSHRKRRRPNRGRRSLIFLASPTGDCPQDQTVVASADAPGTVSSHDAPTGIAGSDPAKHHDRSWNPVLTSSRESGEAKGQEIAQLTCASQLSHVARDRKPYAGRTHKTHPSGAHML